MPLMRLTSMPDTCMSLPSTRMHAGFLTPHQGLSMLHAESILYELTSSNA